MAARDGIEDAKEDLSDGHLTQYSVRYFHFVNIMPFTFERSFNFDRCRWPTSWRFRVNFSVKPEDGTVYCTITVRRTDEKAVVVRGVFWMKLTVAPLDDIPPINFIMPRMPSRFEVRKTYHEIIQYLDMRRIDERGVVVQVSFAVHGCHMDEDLKKLIRRRRKRENKEPRHALCSKL